MSDTTRDSYSRIAPAYTEHIADELAGKPLDRALLARFAEGVRGRGRVLDLGCGPGHVGAYLADLGLGVEGIDLAPGMIEEARRRYPGLRFRVGDMRALDVAAGSLGGIVAFYSILHLPREDVTGVLRGLREALAPGGLLLLAFHVGAEVLRVEELWGVPVLLDFTFFQAEEVSAYLADAGFELLERCDRAPYPGVEHPSRRSYLLATPSPSSPSP